MTCEPYVENVMCQHTKFICMGNQALWICVMLV